MERCLKLWKGGLPSRVFFFTCRYVFPSFFLFFLEYAKVRARHPDLRKRLAGYIIYSFPPFFFLFGICQGAGTRHRFVTTTCRLQVAGFLFFPYIFQSFLFFPFGIRSDVDAFSRRPTSTATDTHLDHNTPRQRRTMQAEPYRGTARARPPIRGGEDTRSYRSEEEEEEGGENEKERRRGKRKEKTLKKKQKKRKDFEEEKKKKRRERSFLFLFFFFFFFFFWRPRYPPPLILLLPHARRAISSDRVGRAYCPAPAAAFFLFIHTRIQPC